MSLPNSGPGWRWLTRALIALAIALGGCAALVDTESGFDPQSDPEDGDQVAGYGVFEAALSSASLLSANGTYGAGCAGGRANGAWSLVLSAGAPLDNSELSVIRGNTGCVLSLTALRTGAGASALYTAQTPITLSATYPTNGTMFSSAAGSFLANAKLNAVSFSASFVLTVLASSDPNAVTASAAAQYTYDAYILAHETPVSYWRLNETPFSADDFTGTASATLQTPRGAVTWTKSAATSADAVLSDLGRARANTANKSVYVASPVASSADYAVSADIITKSLLADDQAGVILRATGSSDTYYYAGYVLSTSYSLHCLCTPKQWQLWKYVSNIPTLLGWYAAVPTVGSTSKLFLQVRGANLEVFVDGVSRISAFDLVPISGNGNAGLLVGTTGGSLATNATGLHLDNFAAQVFPAVDTVGANPGSYYNPVALGDSGALNSTNTNRAVTWVGSGYMEANRTIGDDFSIEFWFKTASGIGTGVLWYNAAGLVDATSSTSAPSGFGVSVRSDGKVLAGAANSYGCGTLNLSTCTDQATIISSTTPALNAWHHVMFTRAKASGALVLYVDGSSVGTAFGPSAVTLNGASKLDLGRLQTGSNYFSGSLDEVAVYNTVLSAATVLTHYQRR